jgi:N-methylhydantoinase A
MAGSATERYRIGIDVGGTFTDFVLANQQSGGIVRHKEPSVPEDPSRAVSLGIGNLLEKSGVSAGQIDLIVHGTTLAVNAIIQRRGAKLGLVVSKGHRGVLEIGRARLANSYDFTVQKEDPLVPRHLVAPVSARIRFDGSVVAEATPEELEAVAGEMRAAGVAAITVLLLHSYAHPAMEAEVAARLQALLPDVRVSASARIWPERREYERSLVALMNAYVQPMMEQYFDRLEGRVRGLGIAAPIYISANNGGSLGLETARQRPIDTILSGPASGVVAAIASARHAGASRLLTVDIGGTSADFSMIQDWTPQYTTQTQVGDFPLVVPVVNVKAIGAGGGSLVWVDAQGVLKVGPDSAGAAPGPVCYGRGGAVPTVTDCYLVIGLLNPDNFLAGRMRLDVAAARAALETIAAKLGIAGEDAAPRAAEAALRVATAMLSTEIYKGLAEFGEDPRDYALMGFGGAGPTHANMIAEESYIRTVILPAASATFCALGAVMADVKRDYVRSQVIHLADPVEARAALDSVFTALMAEGRRWIATEGALIGAPRFEATLDMRYAGQAFDLTVMLTNDALAGFDIAGITELFHREHEKIYGFRDPDSSVDVTTLRLRIVGSIPAIALPQVEDRAAGPAPLGQRRVFIEDGFRAVPVHRRADVRLGQEIRGPALIEQEDTTVWILPGWSGRMDEIGNIILRAGASA